VEINGNGMVGACFSNRWLYCSLDKQSQLTVGGAADGRPGLGAGKGGVAEATYNTQLEHTAGGSPELSVSISKVLPTCSLINHRQDAHSV